METLASERHDILGDILMFSFRRPAKNRSYSDRTACLGVKSCSFKDALRHAQELSLLEGEITIHNGAGEPIALVSRCSIRSKLGVRVLLDLKLRPEAFEEFMNT